VKSWGAFRPKLEENFLHPVILFLFLGFTALWATSVMSQEKEPQSMTLSFDRYSQREFTRTLPITFREPIRDEFGNTTGYRESQGLNVDDTLIILESAAHAVTVWIECDQTREASTREADLFPKAIIRGDNGAHDDYRFSSLKECHSAVGIAQNRLGAPLAGTAEINSGQEPVMTINPPIVLAFRRGPGEAVGRVSLIDAGRAPK
jgi:hypothetical protein